MTRQQGTLPVQIDPFRLAATGQSFSGQVPVRHMKRLTTALVSDEGSAQVEIQFGVDEIGVRFLQGHITASLEVECQRCLESMTYEVDTDMSVAFVHNEYEIEQLPGGYEPYLVEETPIALVDLLEDELILSLPQVPMHERADCQASKYLQAETHADEATDDLQTENPFEVLAKMKDSD